mgnify:CR=1 FL=1|jgi:hypothetical protein|tara:strand:- start:404 stop:634 length:231 start_codon:yes stop_codon:yes gene_type:complete
MIQITIEYTFKGQHLKVTQTTSDESRVNRWTMICEEQIQQHIRESLMDLCLGWEKTMELEHKELAKFDKKKKITIK